MNKRAISWIAWILVLGITVTLVTAMIFWSKGQISTLSEATVKYVSGREECKSVKIDAWGNPPDCDALNITNKGYVKISNARLHLDKGNVNDRVAMFGQEIVPTATKENDTISAFSSADILPIVNVKGELYGCSDKVLTISCP